MVPHCRIRRFSFAIATAFGFAWLVPAAQATVVQTVYSPSNTQLWNNSAVWGGNAVTSGEDYLAVAGGTSTTSFTVTVGSSTKIWSFKGQVRDTSGSAPASTTFNGHSLIFAAETRLLGKGRNTTTTASFVLQDNSHLVLAPDGTGTTTFAGTISVSGSTAIGIQTNGATTLNINAPITGSGTLSLVNTGSAAATLNLNSDISGFTGTLLVSNATGKTGATGSFAISQSSLSSALQINYASPFFQYDLSTNNVTFASLILGENQVLPGGVYFAADLNGLTGGGSRFIGSGSITVVPEPQTVSLIICAMLVGMVVFRSRVRCAAEMFA